MSETKKKLVWDNCKLLGEVQKAPSSKLRVELVARDGIKYINIREWYMKKSENVWKPGLSGFAIPINLPIDGTIVAPTGELMMFISKGINEAHDFAIQDEANAVWVEVKPKK